MKIIDILAKLKKGEELNDAEKKFLAEYDHEKATNEAAAAARREAEAKAQKALKAREDELNAELEKLRTEAEKKVTDKQTEAEKLQISIEALTKQVSGLTEARDKAEKQAAAVARSQGIRDAAKAAGIALAPKMVSEKLFYQMLEASVGDIDISDATALTAALDGFKTANPGIIAAPGSGSGNIPGQPTLGTPSIKNPFAKDSFNLTEQMKLVKSDRAKAEQLAAEAGVKLD